MELVQIGDGGRLGGVGLVSGGVVWECAGMGSMGVVCGGLGVIYLFIVQNYATNTYKSPLLGNFKNLFKKPALWQR